MNERIEILDKFLPKVVRVHGSEHPELADILTQYNLLKDALLADAESETAAQIRAEIDRLTDHFTLPADACPAYEKVYENLKEL